MSEGYEVPTDLPGSTGISTSSNMVEIIYCYIGCGDEVTQWYYSSSTQLIEVVNTYDLGVVSHIQRIGCPTEKNVDALFISRITFSFFEATAVHCASDAATMMTYVGCCVGSGTGNHFLEHWRTKLQVLVKLTLIARQGAPENQQKQKHCSASIKHGSNNILLHRL